MNNQLPADEACGSLHLVLPDNRDTGWMEFGGMGFDMDEAKAHLKLAGLTNTIS